MARLGRMLSALDRKRTPVHVTPVARRMIESMAAARVNRLSAVANRCLSW